MKSPHTIIPYKICLGTSLRIYCIQAESLASHLHTHKWVFEGCYPTIPSKVVELCSLNQIPYRIVAETIAHPTLHVPSNLLSHPKRFSSHATCSRPSSQVTCSGPKRFSFQVTCSCPKQLALVPSASRPKHLLS